MFSSFQSNRVLLHIFNVLTDAIVILKDYTGQKMKFSIKDFFSKRDQIRSFLRIWSHLLKKSLMESIIFCAVCQPLFAKKIHY